MISKQKAVKMLRALLGAIEGLDEREFEQLMAGTGKLVFSAQRSDATKSPPSSDHDAVVVQRLNECKDRDEARSLLQSVSSRDALAALARSMRVHVIKQDRREQIESKIIEFVIGGKLRTEAIQSLNLKSGSGTPSGMKEQPPHNPNDEPT